MKRILVMALSVILALIVTTPFVAAQSTTTQQSASTTGTVVPPGKNANYAELSKRWWNWAYSVPAKSSPLAEAIEKSGTKCATAQTGDTWFLGGLFTAPGEPFPEGGHVERACTVPEGKSLFFPIFNTECSTVESNPPVIDANGNPIPSETYMQAHPEVRDTLQGCAKYAIDWGLGLLPAGEPPPPYSSGGEHSLATLEASVDGVPIGQLNPKDTRYRVASGPFKLTLAENSIDTFCLADPPNGTYVQCPAVTTDAAADGVYLLLAPLSPGSHKIHFGGTFFDGGFPLDVNYDIKVVKPTR